MRSFGATALFMLAIVTECLSAQDRSRQRSGPIRSVPVAADIKKDVDFDCPEEFGYYPHPTDCRFYYVCVFGGALLESCTGGLMYSHELQTCDWPRNVGCDATGVVGGEDLERYSERDTPPPPPPPPRRTPPPPPPRAQPNPIITSRGQPKFNRNEYEKQQQLYAEVDDLPPVEEIETDRQQRVYRGQPSTIGQVQKDRDGYASQVISSGRTLNSNIIPASISQNSKIGSFSFGSQVDERRTATVTQAPQTYSGKVSENVTETLDRLIDLKTNEIPVTDVANKKHLRTKRQTTDKELGSTENKNITQDKISKRNDNDQEMEYVEVDAEILQDDYEDDINQDESERGKRQIRYYLKNGQKTPAKIWPNSKQLKYVNLQQLNYNPNIQSSRFQPIYSGDYNGAVRQQYPSESNYYSTANPFIVYQSQSQNPFKPSLPDPLKQKPAHNSLNTNTQVITKSPPISSLNNHDNPFAALAGGFYNNDQSQNNKQVASQFMSSLNRPSFVSFPDSAHHTSTIVTAKPIPVSTSPRKPFNYEVNPVKIQDTKDNIRHDQSNRNVKNQQKYASRPGYNDQNYDDEDEDSEEESSEEDLSENSNEKFKYNFPNPPHEYTHPRNKFANIENPFAKPDFDFDAFLDKLRNDHYAVIGITTPKPKNTYNAIKIINAPQEVTTASNLNPAGFRSSTQNYNGISTPRPFTMPNGISNTISPTQSSSSSTTKQFQQFQQQQKLQQSQPNPSNQQKFQQQHDAGTPLETLRPKLKPPNFKDDRQLPIIYNFNKPIEVGNQATSPTMKFQKETQQLYSVTQKPFYFVTATGSPVIYSTSKNQFVIRPNNVISLQPQFVSTMKPYVSSSVKPQNSFAAHTYSTSKPLTTLTNDQLSALQHYWRNPSTQVTLQPSLRQTTFSKLENLFVQTLRPTSQVQNNNYNAGNNFVSSTTKVPPTRKLIPKPSPEMSDYYYDEDDEQYYYEPPVKPKYMPSTEVKPQRPPMAQNYQEYEDSIEDSAVDNPSNIKYPRPAGRRPAKYSSLQPESVTKNLNDVSVVTKSPFKESSKAINGKLVSAMINYVTSTPSILKRPEVSNYDIIHHNSRNRTIHIRRPIRYENNPNTLRPPKYLNQTTLRPYTVRHRLAKPTTVKDGREDNKQTKGIMRHPNIVAQMKFTTPRDSYKQETRYTKTKHDDRTNSLEPTESVTPASYSASPRPKMLYNGSQNYSPDQYDPYYAVYDEDGELYKDTDYVQQYNTASLRPAVQQTYRGTPPPARRPVETYTPRPVSPDDYDDALIQGQISNQNQYQSPVRQPSRPTSTRGRGSAHYSTSSVSETPQQAAPNRGTPPTRSRPTLKPSTAIVSKTTEFVDIYAYPPKRPSPVYPQPTPDKTAAKCRKDVCLLPDCYCGGKDIPGDLPVETVPQIVLLTFDDSVNDLNKVLYSDLFDKGRVNPNGCPISATFYVSHEWTDYSQVQNLYSAGHEMASHTISHSFGEQFSQKKWNREVGGQREILAAYGGVKLEDVRGMRAPFLSVGGNKMFKMLYDSNFTYDSSLPVYENRPPSWPYTLDYKLFHDCMIPPCPTKSYPGVWEVPMVMWQDLNGGRCSMGDACANPPEAEGVYKMLLKNFDRHYTTNRAPFGLFYHAAWFTQPHHKEGFIMFLDFINKMKDVWIVTNWQALQWVRDPTPISRLNNFQPFQCNYQDRPKKCNNPKVCNLWHKSGVRYMRTCQPCPEIYPWTGKSGIRSSKIDNDIGE
ncbi:uncharacterized protein Cda5 isoform X6 [Epargyreus clarus]|uniref:uncharacterized protein Cda5 isoform X6 n=1 Tax=Epargyreus clarus TaxID=520877 RepID=UPI003C2D9D80